MKLISQEPTTWIVVYTCLPQYSLHFTHIYLNERYSGEPASVNHISQMPSSKKSTSQKTSMKNCISQIPASKNRTSQMTKLRNYISQIPTSKNRTSQMTKLKNSISQTPTSKDSTSQKTNLKNCIIQSCLNDLHLRYPPQRQEDHRSLVVELCLVNCILQMPTSRNSTYQKPTLMTCISQMPTWRNAL